ncbi:MAG: Gfo/Idh/MocA family oxidoreductase [Burkholderiales bacterium]
MTDGPRTGSSARLRLGVAGLGRAFMLMLPTFAAHARVHVVAAADPRSEARERFAADFGGRTYATVDALADDPDVDALYIASPHQFHAEHVVAAARRGKHVLVEKPMAVTLAECDAMIEAARAGGVRLIVGHSHSFDAPILHTRALIESGAFGRVRMITAAYYTDFLYRPRRPEELDTARGGGVVFSQGAHQIDVVRLLAGGDARSVRAMTGAWDPARPTEGAYSALLTFADGAFATLTYSGYAHFDGDELCGGIGELGHRKVPGRYGVARALTAGPLSGGQEAALKTARMYGSTNESIARPDAHNHFGLVIVSCDRADLRPMPDGVAIYGDDARRFDALAPPSVPRAEVLDELCDAVMGLRVPVHTGEWARATLEVCLALLASSRQGTEIALTRQVALAPAAAGVR